MPVRIVLIGVICWCLVAACGFEERTAARVAANVFAIEEAQKIQREIQRNGRCPEDLAGWSRNTDIGALAPFETSAGTDKVRFPLRFNCHDGADFSITIKLGIDEWTYVVGGATVPISIQYGHFTDLREIKIPPGADVHAIAATAARG
jgi:hypothetical protein